MVSLPVITHEYIVRGPGSIPNLDSPLSDSILENLKANPNNSLIEAETGRTFKFGDVLQQSAAVAEWLRSKGIKPNDVVGINSENRLEYAVPLAGTLFAGATVSTYNPLYTIDELKHVLSISRPRVVFCSPFTAAKMKEVQRDMPFLQEIVLFDFGKPVEGFTCFSEIVKRKIDVKSFRCTKIVAKDTVAAILCSSGTTGLPKSVDLTHSNLKCFLTVAEAAQIVPVSTGGEDAILGLVPFFHGYGISLLMASLIINMKLIVMSKFDEKIFLSSIEKYKINRLHIVPPLALFLARHPLVDKYNLSSLKTIVCGAAPLSKEIEVALKKRLRSVDDVRQAYGMTELSIAATIPPANARKVGSVGVVFSGVELKVIDVETGKALPPFKEGELCFRGPLVMKGYRNNPTATAETLDSDGWLHTGDIGYYDEEGFVFIVDRLKELIKFKGFQVAPAELEALLLTYPKVKDAGVVGLPNEEVGEFPVAFVVLVPGVQATEDEIKKFVAGKVSPQKRLQYVRFVNEIPKNPSGKILRKDLRKMLAKSKL